MRKLILILALLTSMAFASPPKINITVIGEQNIDTKRARGLVELLFSQPGLENYSPKVTVTFLPYSQFEDLLIGKIPVEVYRQVKGEGIVYRGLSKSQDVNTLEIWMYQLTDKILAHEVLHYFFRWSTPQTFHTEPQVEDMTSMFLAGSAYKDWLRENH